MTRESAPVQELIRQQLADSIAVQQAVAETLTEQIAAAVEALLASLQGGGLVAFCGNGGSAADAQHLAGELVGRFRRERPAYRAVALSTNTSILTAIGNDYGYDQVFRRQVEALLRPGDVLVALSTSGQAANCVLAAQQAHRQGASVVALTGAGGGRLGEVADLCLAVPATVTPRIQEAHIVIGHIICDLVEAALVEQGAG